MGMYVHLRELDDEEARTLAGGRVGRDILRLREPAGLSLEKAWHGLHYLLNGTPVEGGDPLGFLLSGGREVGPDTGYGRPRLLPPDFVRRLHAALAAIDDDQLWARFDPQLLEAEGVYPGIWDEPEDDLRDEYLGYFHELKDYVARAATDGAHILVTLS